MANQPNKRQDPDSEQPWQPGQLLLADFDVQQVLGQGGMGKVYLVRSRTTAVEFAVKRALIKDNNSRQNFLSELQTWIDLPEHPNIAACRFFRTIGDEIVIFSEYVGGGTLADWIRDRRLRTLEQILDVAIQFAWGLQALHEHGLIHQDVKPGNVLMTPEGIAKVTDFGLARARLRIADGQFYSPTDAPNGQSMLVSMGGMTQAYCSPEQAAKRPLSRKTDIWSWGVSVLDIFYGQPSCLYGQSAGESLEAYFQDETLDKKLPRMPVEMTMLLGKCFLPKPEHRWDSMGEVADALVQIYNKAGGRAYPRQVSAISSPKSGTMPAHDRRTAANIKWDDPREWLRKALQASGRDPAEADSLVQPRTGSHRAQAISDLAVYEVAYRIFEQLIASGRKDVRSQLAELCANKALLHEYTHDVPGALALFDGAIRIYEQLVKQEARSELANYLAAVYVNKANAVKACGDNQSASALYDRAIKIFDKLVNQHGRSELANALASTYVNKANAIRNLGNIKSALVLYDRAIAIRERLVNYEGQRDLADGLALAYSSKANAVQ